MLSFFSKSAAPRSGLAYALTTELHVQGRDVVQTQVVTDRYVATRLDRATLLFWPERDARFRVDHAQRSLVAVDAAAPRAQVARLREAMGTVHVACDPALEEVEGFRCRHLRLHNEHARVILSADTYVTAVPGLERTALARERAHDREVEPISLPLEADEVVVLSVLRLLAQEVEQNQRARLVSVAAEVDDLDAWDDLLTYRIAD